ncbi:MAG: hypothetical protein U0Y96_05040 [Candidatus Kapaibacterium sp.]
MVIRFAIVSLVLICFANTYNLYAQQEVLENISQESNSSPQVDALDYYKENPLVIHTTTASKLAQLPTITLTTARKIIKLAKQYPQIDISDIADSLDLPTEQRTILEQCTVMDESIRKNNRLVVWRVRNQQNLNQQAGFTNNAFVGSPLDVYQRLTISHSFLQANVITNKDPGEQTLTDFVSGYAQASLGENTTLILGDYYIESGAGTILWKNFGAKKGPDVVSPPSQFGSGIHPYRSTIDYRFFRGGTIQHVQSIGSTTDITARAWYSQLPRTATIDVPSNTITSLDIDGQYRTSSEIAKRGSIKETSFGGSVECRIGELTVGTTALFLQYDKEIVSSSTGAFSGKDGMLNAVYAKYSTTGMTLITELGKDAKNNLGYKLGGEFNNKTVNASVFFRSYSAEFRSPFGYNFGEYSAPNNETGLYIGALWRAARGVRIQSYVDVYASSVPRFGMPVPTRGFDMFNEVQWQINRTSTVSARLRYEDKTDASSFEGLGAQSFQASKATLRLEASKAVSDVISARCRFEISELRYEGYKPKELGVAGYGELTYMLNERTKLGARYALFSTESFASAIYLYELVAPGYFASVPVYEQGMRSYIYLKTTPLDFISIWCRYAVTTRNNTKSLSSGVTEIVGQSEQKIMLQLDVQL